MELLAAGRTADVYAIDDETVLRRYRVDISVEPEARLMRELDVLGYPVPHVHAAIGRDLTMANIVGPTILEELLREPGQVERYGRELGELHERLHRIPAAAWLRRMPGTPADAAANVVHLDFHPDNVVLSTRGPVVLDWTNAAAGRPEIDVALTMLIMLSVDAAELVGGKASAPALGALRNLFLIAYLATCGADPRRGLADAIEYRLNDPMLLPAERSWIELNGRDCLDPFVLGRV